MKADFKIGEIIRFVGPWFYHSNKNYSGWMEHPYKVEIFDIGVNHLKVGNPAIPGDYALIHRRQVTHRIKKKPKPVSVTFQNKVEVNVIQEAFVVHEVMRPLIGKLVNVTVTELRKK